MRVEVLIDQPRVSLRRRDWAGVVAVVGALWCALAGGFEVRAGDANEVRPTSLRVMPAAVVLRGPDAVQQLAIDGLSAGVEGAGRDPAGEVREFRSAGCDS